MTVRYDVDLFTPDVQLTAQSAIGQVEVRWTSTPDSDEQFELWEDRRRRVALIDDGGTWSKSVEPGAHEYQVRAVTPEMWRRASAPIWIFVPGAD